VSRVADVYDNDADTEVATKAQHEDWRWSRPSLARYSAPGWWWDLGFDAAAGPGQRHLLGGVSRSAQTAATIDTWAPC